MTSAKQSSNLLGVILIGLGIFLLILNFIPRYLMHHSWWFIFFILAAGFFLPALIWPKARPGLAALFIPGSIMAVLGLIFMYNTTTDNWESWEYLWTLLPASAGLGLFLAGKYGNWEKGVAQVGIWILVFSLAGFIFFSGSAVKTVGAIILILLGIWLLGKRNKPATESTSVTPSADE